MMRNTINAFAVARQASLADFPRASGPSMLFSPDARASRRAGFATIKRWLDDYDALTLFPLTDLRTEVAKDLASWLRPHPD
jgi:hypothetical protein